VAASAGCQQIPAAVETVGQTAALGTETFGQTADLGAETVGAETVAVGAETVAAVGAETVAAVVAVSGLAVFSLGRTVPEAWGQWLTGGHPVRGHLAAGSYSVWV